MGTIQAWLSDVTTVALFGFMFGLGALLIAIFVRIDHDKLEEKVERMDKRMMGTSTSANP